MIRVWVELSGESEALARAEVAGAAKALGGRPSGVDAAWIPGVAPVELPNLATAAALARRLALAHRVLGELPDGADPETAARREGTGGQPASFRRLGRPSSGGADVEVRRLGGLYKAAGGRINLERPERRFWLAQAPAGTPLLMEELGAVDRSAYGRRRLVELPFRRPVTLDPRLARAAANLAAIRPGDRVVDPFLGTGSLLAEAALIGARVHGIDRDPAMVRGAMANFAHLGIEAERLVVGDAEEVAGVEDWDPVDAVLTDPPYGRASATGAETAADVVRRVLPRWASLVRPGGRVVVVMPGGADPLAASWRRELSVPVRVHRSLTREFRVYRRVAEATRTE